jgi:hypothetical protein
MEDSDMDGSYVYELLSYICPADGAPAGDAEAFYRKCMKNHDGKIPAVHRSDREAICDLFFRDVKIRETLKECIADIPAREKLRNLFF